MALPSGAHVRVGGVEYELDEDYEQKTGRRCYVHGGRSLFAEQITPTGRPGSENLRNDLLRWFITDFDGEGQVVLNNRDEVGARRFYRSEGLDMRTSGQFQLNASSVAQSPAQSGAAGTTYQGNADFTDITGTSTTSGTDRTLVAVGDKIGMSADYAPGAGKVQADFYLYLPTYAGGATTIAGSDLKLAAGDGEVSGGDFKLMIPGSMARTAIKSTGSDFLATAIQRVEFFAHIGGVSTSLSGRFYIFDVTNGWDARRTIREERVTIRDTSAPSTATCVQRFDPVAGHDYRFAVEWGAGSEQQAGADRILVDEIRFGNDVTENVATIEVYNTTGSVSVQTKDVSISGTASFLAGSIVFTAAGATNYRARIARKSGKQAVIVDKVSFNDQSSSAFTLDVCEMGLGGDIYLAGHVAGSDSFVWKYDDVNDDWDEVGALNDASSTNATAVATFHSDSLQYFVLNNDSIRTVTSGGVDDAYASFAAGTHDLVGGCIAQARVMVMEEDASGVTLWVGPVDGTATPYAIDTDTTNWTSTTIDLGSKTPDANLRQRMCSAPTGARFFVNFGDSTAKVYEASMAEDTIETNEIADLGKGITAKAIAHDAGYTFVSGMFQAEADQTPRSALWIIAPNGVVERVGYYRRDDPNANPVCFLVPYQNDVFMLQGPFVWRYSLITGGLFCEYELNPQTASAARALAVTQGRSFACYDGEVWVTGSVNAYRQAGVSGGNSLTSSVYDYGLPGTKKTLLSIQLLTEQLAANTSVTLEYQLDGDNTWVLAGVMSAGSDQVFSISDESSEQQFNSIQVRATLKTLDGVATPIVRGIVVVAQAADQEEYFDLVLRCEDEDSYDHPAGNQLKGSYRIANVVDLWRRGTPTTFIDGYADKLGGYTESYRVVIQDIRAELNALGEGRVVTTLKVIR